MIKNLNWQEATSLLFTGMDEGLITERPRKNPAIGQSGTRTDSDGAAGLRVRRRADHSATPPHAHSLHPLSSQSPFMGLYGDIFVKSMILCDNSELTQQDVREKKTANLV